jgi:hypothetical protein
LAVAGLGIKEQKSFMSYQQLGQPRRHTGGARRFVRQPSSSAVIATGVSVAVLAMVAVISIGRPDSPPAAGRSGATWQQSWRTQAPIPLQSDPSEPVSFPPAPSPPPTPTRAAAAKGERQQAVRHVSPSATPSRTPARMLPAPGSRLSLLAIGTANLRLRHQDFKMRLAAVGSGSPGLARADATFVLRPGLADPRCISLESVNFPGYFMRHHNFVLLLTPAGRSRSFAGDATFCAQAVGPDADFRLRSHNFPDRYLTARRSVLSLSPAPPGYAQSFRATPGF